MDIASHRHTASPDRPTGHPELDSIIVGLERIIEKCNRPLRRAASAELQTPGLIARERLLSSLNGVTDSVGKLFEALAQSVPAVSGPGTQAFTPPSKLELLKAAGSLQHLALEFPASYSGRAPDFQLEGIRIMAAWPEFDKQYALPCPVDFKRFAANVISTTKLPGVSRLSYSEAKELQSLAIETQILALDVVSTVSLLANHLKLSDQDLTQPERRSVLAELKNLEGFLAVNTNNTAIHYPGMVSFEELEAFRLKLGERSAEENAKVSNIYFDYQLSKSYADLTKITSPSPSQQLEMIAINLSQAVLREALIRKSDSHYGAENIFSLYFTAYKDALRSKLPQGFDLIKPFDPSALMLSLSERGKLSERDLHGIEYYARSLADLVCQPENNALPKLPLMKVAISATRTLSAIGKLFEQGEPHRLYNLFESEQKIISAATKLIAGIDYGEKQNQQEETMLTAATLLGSVQSIFSRHQRCNAAGTDPEILKAMIDGLEIATAKVRAKLSENDLTTFESEVLRASER